MQRPIQTTDRTTWGAIAVLLILAAVCLAAGAINAGPGFDVDGERVRLQLQSAVTNYPFCPPQIPCPISMTLPEDHWVVWIIRERIGVEEETPNFRKLIDIRLP